MHRIFTSQNFTSLQLIPIDSVVNDTETFFVLSFSQGSLQ